jgi:hypothetical protein
MLSHYYHVSSGQFVLCDLQGGDKLFVICVCKSISLFCKIDANVFNEAIEFVLTSLLVNIGVGL